MRNRFVFLAVLACCVVVTQVGADVTFPGSDTITFGSGMDTMTFRKSGAALAVQNPDGNGGQLNAGCLLVNHPAGLASTVECSGKRLQVLPQWVSVGNATTAHQFRVTSTRPEIWGPASMVNSDLTFDTTGAGPVIRSPNNSKWRVVVDNAGALSTVSVP